jgi:trimeric autotransporter adhesin
MVRKISFALLALIIGLSPLLNVIPVSATTLYEYDTYQDSNSLFNGALNWDAQTFTPATSHAITEIRILTMAGGDPGSTTTTLKITNTTGAHPGTDVLGTATFSNSGIGTTYPDSFVWKVATFSTPVNVNSGTKYAIVASTDLAAGMYWGKDTGNHLANGNSETTTNAGSSWTTAATHDYTFQVYADPLVVAPAVTTDAATSVTSTTAVLNGNLTDMGSDASVQVNFEHGYTTAYEIASEGYATKNTTGTFSVTLTGLTPNTTYHYRAECFSGSLAAMGYGADATFTTSPAIMTVTTADATYINAAAAVLNGNITDLGGYANATVGFNIGNTTAYGETMNGFPLVLTDEGTFTGIAYGLTSNTTYHFRAFALANGTVLFNAADYTFVTSAPPVPNTLAIMTDAATSINNTNATLNGNLTALGHYLPQVGFHYGQFRGYWTDTVVGQMNATGTYSYLLTGLRAGTTYYYQAFATDAGTPYPGREGAILDFTTSGSYSPSTTFTVTTNKGEAIGQNTIRLKGSINSMGLNTHAYVGFDYGLTTAYGSTYTAPVAMSDTGGFDYIIAGVYSPGQVIHYRAGAIGDYQDSFGSTVAYGADMTITVGQTPYGSPTPTPTGTATPSPTITPPINIPSNFGPSVASYEWLIGLTLGCPFLLMFIFSDRQYRWLGVMCSILAVFGVWALWYYMSWLDGWFIGLMITMVALLAIILGKRVFA